MSTVQYIHYPSIGSDGAPLQVDIPLDAAPAVGATGEAVSGGAFLTYSTDNDSPDWSTTPDAVELADAADFPLIGSYISTGGGVNFLVLLFAVPVNYPVQVHAWRFIP